MLAGVSGAGTVGGRSGAAGENHGGSTPSVSGQVTQSKHPQETHPVFPQSY